MVKKVNKLIPNLYGEKLKCTLETLRRRNLKFIEGLKIKNL